MSVKLHFDRLFSDNRKIWKQVLYVLLLIVVLVAIIAVIGCWLLKINNVDITKGSALIQSVGLAFGASNIPPGEGQTFPLLWQALAFLLGAVFFSGVTITWVGNWLSNRQEAYRNGSARYRFRNHILFFGGCEIVDQMLKDFGDKGNIVVLTSGDVSAIRLRINRPDITVLYGRRDDKSTLKSVYVKRASKIYIVGEDPNNEEYDNRNVACWSIVRDLCEGRKRIKVPCYLMLEHTLSTRLFYLSDLLNIESLNTILINRHELMTQKIFVHNSSVQNGIPPLDRKGIGRDDERVVHLVLYGMSSFSRALAITAAHICHFPNFVKRNEDGTFGENIERRTRITFIAPDIKRESSKFISQYSQLFERSTVTIIDSSLPPIVKTPKEDFLDVEWEFVDGYIDDERIRRLLSQYYVDNLEGKTYLTIAMCLQDTQSNIAAAIFHLPDEYHNILFEQYDRSTIDYEKTIPILLYQQENEELAQIVKRTLPKYSNIIPVGSVKDNYGATLSRRVLQGKRIKYIYFKGMAYDGMPTDQNELDILWGDAKLSKLSNVCDTDPINQMSNIYSAAHIGVKLRSVGNHTKLTDEDIEVLAVTEHNRWNMEKLLMGFEALPKEERDKRNTLGGLADLKALKRQLKHYCIAPYKELSHIDRSYDKLLVNNMRDVVEDER